MSSLPHGCALILYGVGIKTASVSSGRSAPRHRTQPWVSCAPGDVLARLGKWKMMSFTHLAAWGEAPPLAIRSPLSVWAHVPGTNSTGPAQHGEQSPPCKDIQSTHWVLLA